MTKEQILAEIRLTRASIATDVAALRHELDFEAKFNAEVRKKPWMWFGGAAAVGWWLAGPKTRKRVVTKVVDAKGHKVKVETKKRGGRMGLAGIVFTLLKLAFPYFKPAVLSFVSRQATQWIATSRK